MARRVYTPVRLGENGLNFITEAAKKETDGNISEMIRKLLGEAITARQKRQGH
jgi:hypothetical protein